MSTYNPEEELEKLDLKVLALNADLEKGGKHRGADVAMFRDIVEMQRAALIAEIKKLKAIEALKPFAGEGEI